MIKIKKNSVFKKLIQLFVTLMLPIIIISFFALQTSNAKLENQILTSVAEATTNFANNLDKDLEQIYVTSASTAANSYLKKLSYISHTMKKYDKIEAVHIIRELITNIKSSHELVSNIRVYVKSMQQAYNADSYEKGSVQSITDEEYQTLVNHYENKKGIRYQDGHLVLYIGSSFHDPLYLMEIEFSTDMLSKYLKMYVSYENEYVLLTFNESDLVINNMTSSLKEEALKIAKDTDTSSISRFISEGNVYHVFKAPLSYMNGTIVRFVPNNALLQPMQLSTTITILFLLAIFSCMLIFFYGSFRLIHKPLKKLVDAFSSVEGGNFNILIEDESENDFSYLYTSFNDMTMKLTQLIERDYQQKMLLQQSELKQLQAQINPHFLYNSFFMLQRMIKRGMQEEAEIVSKELGSYFQYITRNSSNIVPLIDEYQHAKTYANIQSMRFEGRIRIEFLELPEQYNQLPIPKLILQPIIENAFNYGLENKIEEGLLKVTICSLANQIHIIIEDNGEELTDEKLSSICHDLQDLSNNSCIKETTGILNIYKRLMIFSNYNSNLTVERSPLGGMKVAIMLQDNTSKINEYT